MKKLVIFWLTILFSIGAVAQGDEYIVEQGTLGHVTWKLDDEGFLYILPISGTDGEMPIFYNASYSPWAGRDDIKKIYIRDGVTSVSSYAFKGCTSVYYLYLSNTLKSIGNYTFSGCSRLFTLGFPKSLETIGKEAFSETTALGFMTFSGGLKEVASDAFKGSKWWNQRPDGLVYVDNVAYKYKGTMPENKSISLDDYTVAIADYCFMGCSGLKSIEIPNTVITIGKNAFYKCTGLTSVVIPEGVTTIKNSAFEDCENLSDITFPNSLIDVASTAFDDTKWYSKQPSFTMLYAGRVAFYYKEYFSEGTSLTLKEGTRYLGSDALYGLERSGNMRPGEHYYPGRDLKEIILPSTLQELDPYSFNNNDGLVSVVARMPEPVELKGKRTIGRDDCVLTVPWGKKDAYIAAGWTEEIFRGGIVEAAYDNKLCNYLTLQPITAYRGSTISVPVGLTNRTPIETFSFYVDEPKEVLTLKGGELSDRANGHTGGAFNNGGYTQFTCQRAGYNCFKGTSGDLAYIKFDVKENAKVGNFAFRIYATSLTTTYHDMITGQELYVNLKLLDPIRGDANCDGEVTITDGLSAVYKVLNKDLRNFGYLAADLDDSGDITITDALAIVKKVLSGSSSASAKERVVDEVEMLDPQ